MLRTRESRKVATDLHNIQVVLKTTQNKCCPMFCQSRSNFRLHSIVFDGLLSRHAPKPLEPTMGKKTCLVIPRKKLNKQERVTRPRTFLRSPFAARSNQEWWSLFESSGLLKSSHTISNAGVTFSWYVRCGCASVIILKRGSRNRTHKRPPGTKLTPNFLRIS